MDILSKEELRMLVQIGYAACMSGQVNQAKAIFDNLLIANPDCAPAKVGEAFLCMVCDQFQKGDEILQAIVSGPDVSINDEAYALLCFSAALQRNQEAFDHYSGLVSANNKAALTLVDSARSILDNAA